MVLHPAQNSIALDSHRYRVVNCGRQFGKTTLAIEEIKGFALAKNARIAYIATTIQQARDIAWSILKSELSGVTIKVKESPSLEIEVANMLGGSSIIQIKGWESIETLRGQQFDLIVLDEVASMRNFWLNWQEVLIPTLSFRKGSVIFISTPKGFNHFYDLFNQELKDKDFKSFHFTSYDNPYLDKDELEKTKTKTTEDRFAQEYMADFRKQQGLVYKEFSRDRHLFDSELKDCVEYFAGIDFGFTNPTAVVHIKRDRDENLYVVDEWYKRERTEEQVAEYVKSCNFNKVYPDPESPSAIDLLNSKGVAVVEVLKNKDSITNGINQIRELFKTGKLKIHKKCVNLIGELETYAYPENRNTTTESENPIKEHDHALDALRYAISNNKTSVISIEERIQIITERRRNSNPSIR